MNYYLDTEFDGPGGQLLSLGLVREDGASLYATLRLTQPIRDEWVAFNVMPHMYDIPSFGIDYKLIDVKPATLTQGLYNFLSLDTELPNIVVDWPEDLVYFCKAIQVGPGRMIDLASISFLMVRGDSYPTDLPGAVQHNAYWDAMALRQMFLPPEPGPQGENDNPIG